MRFTLGPTPQPGVSRCLARRLPDCLIVDLHMPNMTGLELQRHLTHCGIRIPTIVITAHSETEARDQCESAGASAFLFKPLQDNLLLAAIDSVRGGHKT
jgi:FixJ family two-component response regulator